VIEMACYDAEPTHTREVDKNIEQRHRIRATRQTADEGCSLQAERTLAESPVHGSAQR
jgi:hypothetical protein